MTRHDARQPADSVRMPLTSTYGPIGVRIAPRTATVASMTYPPDQIPPGAADVLLIAVLAVIIGAPIAVIAVLVHRLLAGV